MVTLPFLPPIRSTPDNSPVVADPQNGTLSVTRYSPTRQRRPMYFNPGAAVATGGLEGLGCLLIGGAIVLAILSLVATFVVPLVLPVIFMAQKARQRPTPPAAGIYTAIVSVLAVVPVILIGFILSTFPAITGAAGNLPISSLGLFGAIAAIPAAFVAWYYYHNLKIADTHYLNAVAIGLEKAQRENEQRRIAAEQEAERQRQAELEAIAARRIEAIGKLRQPQIQTLGLAYMRQWDSPNNRFATWLNSGRETDDDFITLTPDNLNRHVLIVAPTRAGKTANVIRPLIDYCRRNGHAAIFFDPKGNDLDPRLFDVSFSMLPAERDSSIRLCLIDPQIARERPLQAARKLAEGLIPEAREVYFSNAAREALTALMFAHYVVYGQYPELAEARAYMVMAERREELAKRLLERDAEATSPKERDQISDAINLLGAVTETSSARGDVLGSLRQALLPLATGEFKEYITTNPARGLTIRQMLDMRLTARIAFTVTEGEIGQSLGRVVIQQYTDAVLDPAADKSYLKLCVIDEAHNYICDSLTRGVAQAAGNNAGYVLAFQSLRQITDENARSVIFGNCKNKIVLAGLDPKDADDFSRYFGEADLPYTSVNAGQNQGYGQNQSYGQNQGVSYGASSGGGVWGTQSTSESYGTNQGYGQSQNYGQSRGMSVSYHRRPIWLPAEIGQIPRYHAICVLDNGEAEPAPRLMGFLDETTRATIREIMQQQPAPLPERTKEPIPEAIYVRHQTDQPHGQHRAAPKAEPAAPATAAAPTPSRAAAAMPTATALGAETATASQQPDAATQPKAEPQRTEPDDIRPVAPPVTPINETGALL